MNWSGRVGEVRELFRSELLVGYHWVVPKIFSMPERVGPIFYSPTFKFLNMTWYFGIYRYSTIGDEEWIGFEIRRSTNCSLMPVRFSVGLMQADKSECLLHRNQYFPSRDNVCSINEFLLTSFLLKAKDKLAPFDELIVTCVICPDVPASGECKEFCHSEENMNPGDEVHAHKNAERKYAVAEDVLMTEGFLNVDTATKSITESNKPPGNDGPHRGISRGDNLNCDLPLWKMTRDFLDPEITCRRKKYDVRSRSKSDLSSKEFSQSTQSWNSSIRLNEARAHKKAIRKEASVTDVPVTEDQSHGVQTETKSIAVSDKPSGNDGTLREISRGVEWDIRLPPSKTTWDVLSPEFTCGEIKYHFSMYSSELHSDDIYLGFIVNITNDANFPLPIRWRMAIKRRNFGGLSWIMNGQMIAQGECHQHAQEICIKRADLECSLSSDARLTFVHYLSVGGVDGEKEVSTQTGKNEVSHETQTEDQIGGTANLEDFEEQFKLCLTHPEEGDYVHLIQKKPLDASIEKFLSELPRDDKKHLILPA